jgi:predicted O-linked N-acetylglucosamine transferase (SPINDLY family)
MPRAGIFDVGKEFEGGYLRLLLACAQVPLTEARKVTIRNLLGDGVDWTLFARLAVDHGLTGVAGHSLVCAAPDLVPADILNALRTTLEQARRKNRALFDELVDVISALADAGVAAIPFKGPLLALEAYGDVGLRMFGDLDFLVRDGDMPSCMTVLAGLGYERKEVLSLAQIETIQLLQGQDFLFKKASGTGLEPHTRLTPIKMALDVDYAALWDRAQPRTLGGRTLLTLAPEDTLVILAIHGGKEMWWNIKWACDVAAFIATHANLSWTAVLERARMQGCLRMVLLATSLARTQFDADTPDAVRIAERADPAIEPMVGRIMAQWQADDPLGPPSNKTLSMDRLLLHDGLVRRARYVARTLFLPSPHHVAAMPLPRGMRFAYVPIKIGHDLAALPLFRGYRKVLMLAVCLKDAWKNSDLTLSFLPHSAESKARLKRHRQARTDAERAVAEGPKNPATWRNLGQVLHDLKQYKQAILCYERALALAPDNSTIWKNRARALTAIKQPEDFPKIAIDPRDSDAWAIRAGRFLESNRFAEAGEASDRALGLDPGNVAAIRMGIHARLHSCDWSRRDDDKRLVSEGWREGRRLINSVFHRGLCDSEEELSIGAQFRAKKNSRAKAAWQGECYRHDKIRIAYVSTDFRDHVVSDAIVGCFEHRDKRRFELTAISLHASDGSAMRGRIEGAFDRFIDAQSLNDSEVAKIIRELEIDIAVDLNGYSGEMRTKIFALRPAPVQVSYLGFPGTLGEPCIDYIIADRRVIPDDNRRYYTEKVVYLPDTYFPNDNSRRVAANKPNRVDEGLPAKGFVFACFNAPYKIDPAIFAIWMRLLKTVEGSVLWLRSGNPSATVNLWREAKVRGVPSERLVFASRVQRTEDHLARLGLADLFLDTLPYNAHATACDALWAGLPVLTCRGKSFAGMVGASLVHALGMPELETSSLAEYEQMAQTLACDPERFAAIKDKLLRNRITEPLFDTARFTRSLESAYTLMWERQQAGLPPESLTVPS